MRKGAMGRRMLSAIRAVVGCICIGGLVLSVGCVGSGEAGPPRRLAVELSTDGAITVEGQPTRLAGLGQALKGLGAKSSDAIVVSVPGDVGPGTLSALTRQLTAAGFRKVLFRRPRQVDSGLR